MADLAKTEPALTDRQNVWKLLFLVVPALVTSGFSYLKSRQEATSQTKASYTTLRDEVVALQKELAIVKTHSSDLEVQVVAMKEDLETVASHPFLAQPLHQHHKAHQQALSTAMIVSSVDAGFSFEVELSDAGFLLGALPDEEDAPGMLPQFVHRKLPTNLDEVIDEFQNPKKQQHVLQ